MAVRATAIDADWFFAVDPASQAEGEALGARLAVLDGVGARIPWSQAVGEEVDLTAEGHPIEVALQPVDGTNDVEIDAATLHLVGLERVVGMPQLTVGMRGGFHTVVLGGQRLRSLQLGGLKATLKNQTEPRSLTSQGDLSGARLVILVQDAPQGPMTARLSCPGLGGSSFVPPTLPAVSFENGVVKLPDLRAHAIAFAVVDAGAKSPAEFENLSLSVETVSGVGVEYARDVRLTDAASRVLWGTPELAPGAGTTIDLRVSLTGSLREAIVEGRAPATSLRLSGAGGRLSLAPLAPRGRLLRRFSDVMQLELRGEPVTLPFSSALSDEAPTRASAHLSVRYRGVRLVTDATGTPRGPFGGVVVENRPTLHTLSRDQLSGRGLARVGLFGCADAACELSITPVNLAAGPPGRPLGPPGVVRLAPSTRFAWVWADLPGSLAGAAVGLSVRANQGRFLWASGDAPLVRLAVYDDDPGGGVVRVGGATLAAPIDGSPSSVARATLPAVAFRGAAPALESALFARIEFGDLILEYAR